MACFGLLRHREGDSGVNPLAIPEDDVSDFH